MFKNFFQEKKAVLFDLDGTIANTHPIWNQACAEVSQNLGFTWRGYNFLTEPSLEKTWESYLDMSGENYGVPISALVSQTKDKFITKFLSMDPEDILRDGFWVFLNEIRLERKMKAGLVTNSDRDVTETLLKHLGINGLFSAIICGDDVKNRKPDPEMYKKALGALEVKAEEALCFEDSPTGVKAAQKAGLTIIRIKNPLFSDKDFPSNLIFVDDFTVFPGNLDKTKKEVLQESLQKVASSKAEPEQGK